MQKIFTTDRLYIRPMRFSDIDDIVELDADAEVFRSTSMNFGTHQIIKKSDMKKINKKLMRDSNQNNLRWVIISRLEKSFIGCISIENTPNISPTCITYRIIKKEWNKGIISEALPLVIKYLFSEMQFLSLTAVVDVNNLASRRVIEKIGFRNSGILSGNVHAARIVSLEPNKKDLSLLGLVGQNEKATGTYLIYKLFPPVPARENGFD